MSEVGRCMGLIRNTGHLWHLTPNNRQQPSTNRHPTPNTKHNKPDTKPGTQHLTPNTHHWADLVEEVVTEEFEHVTVASLGPVWVHLVLGPLVDAPELDHKFE